MKKVVLILMLFLFINSCTERMTKQFIAEQTGEEVVNFQVKNWVVHSPSLVAFKNKKVESIKNIPYKFWLQLKVNSIKSDQLSNHFKIDSVGLKYAETDSILWRKPTRVVTYKETKEQRFIAFDFFRDEGILIPDSVMNLKLFFDAVLVNKNDSLEEKFPVSFEMFRSEGIELKPFYN